VSSICACIREAYSVAFAEQPSFHFLDKLPCAVMISINQIWSYS